MLWQREEPVLRDFHAGHPGYPTHLGMNLPLARTAQSPAFGALLLGIDPTKYLYPLIQLWPVPSRTAETLLLRREGNGIVYLNKLRHRNNAPLTLTVPLTQADVPAVQAALGKEGIVSGRDYRGEPVLAAVRRVPGTSWFLVAKVDADEVYAPIRRRSITSLVIVSLLILSAGAAIFQLWRRQQLRYYKERYQAELDRRALLGHYDYLTRFANDIILLADESGRIIEEPTTAPSAPTAIRARTLGMPERKLRHASTVGRFEEDWRRAAQHGCGIIETLHRRKDGSTLSVEVSMRFIEVEGQKLYQSIIRDISERKAMVEKSRETAAT